MQKYEVCTFLCISLLSFQNMTSALSHVLTDAPTVTTGLQRSMPDEAVLLRCWFTVCCLEKKCFKVKEEEACCRCLMGSCKYLYSK